MKVVTYKVTKFNRDWQQGNREDIYSFATKLPLSEFGYAIKQYFDSLPHMFITYNLINISQIDDDITSEELKLLGVMPDDEMFKKG